MPFKLIGVIILLIIVTVFCGANLGESNRCDINLIFTTLKDIPAFLTVLVSFFFGAAVVIPFTFKRNKFTKEEIEQAAEKQKSLELKKQQSEEKKKAQEEKKQKTLAERESRKVAAEKKRQAKGKKSAGKTETQPSKNDVPVIMPEKKESVSPDGNSENKAEKKSGTGIPADSSKTDEK